MSLPGPALNEVSNSHSSLPWCIAARIEATRMTVTMRPTCSRISSRKSDVQDGFESKQSSPRRHTAVIPNIEDGYRYIRPSRQPAKTTICG